MQTATFTAIFDFLFQGQAFRCVDDNGEPCPLAADVAAALCLKHYRHVVGDLPAHWRFKRVCALYSIPGTPGCDVHSKHGTSQQSRQQSRQRKTQEVLCLRPAGVMALAAQSRKEHARSFTQWYIDEAVVPFVKYGCAVAGTTPAERITLLRRELARQRELEKAQSNAGITDLGFQTVAQFREENGIAAGCGLKLFNFAQALSGPDVHEVYTGHKMARVFEASILQRAWLLLQCPNPAAALQADRKEVTSSYSLYWRASASKGVASSDLLQLEARP